MRLPWNIIYNMMQQELRNISMNFRLTEKEIERGFTICHRYLSDIRIIKQGVNHDLNFSKNVLPLFMAETEYFSLLSYSQLFLPAEISSQLVFWMREEGRFRKFLEEHKEFLAYYQSGETAKDEFYFASGENFYSTIIAGFLALKKYNCYVRAELKLLKSC